MKFNDTGKVQLFIRSMGKLLRVTAAFMDTKETNEYLVSHKDEGVVAEIQETIFVANVYDKGLKI